MASNRILLDTNVWSYLAEFSSAAVIRRSAKVGAAKVIVAPSTLYEALRFNRPEVRARRAELITDPAWTRLMPEAHAEAHELLNEIRRVRPQWLKSKGNRGEVQRLRHDWGRTKAGFWARVRVNPEQEAKYIIQLDGQDLELARREADARRELLQKSVFSRDTPLSDLLCEPADREEGYEGGKIEPWRFNGWTSTTHAFRRTDHPYLEWLSADLNLEAVTLDKASWLKFWFYEIERSRVPRFWLRWAVEHYQSFYKVTGGTPGDAQLATYLLQADVVVSADKNFLRIVDAVRPYTPVPIARTKLVAADKKGVAETLEFLQISRPPLRP